VDKPANIKDDRNLTVSFKAVVIIVVSAGSGHWGESEFIKLRGEVMGKLKYFPLWSEQELLIARPFLGNDLSEEGIWSAIVNLAECLVMSFLLGQK
jgi:hypothetical protein